MIFTRQQLRPFMYGLADLGPACVDIFLKVYLLLYFNVILGLSPTATSVAIGMGVLWDALIDPWIGIYSDRYYHKNGHRKFLIWTATILSVGVFISIWQVPHLGDGLTFFALFLLSSILNSALSLYSVPYIALANDLEPDNEKRKVWTGWRLAFLNFGAFLGLGVPAVFLTRTAGANETPAYPYQISSVVLGLVMLVCSVVAVRYLYRGEKIKVHDIPHERHKKISELIKDRTYLRLMTSYFVVNCGIGLNSALALYYYKDYLNFTQKQTQTILVSFLAVFTFSIPLWVYLTKFFSKPKLITAGAFLLGVISCICFPHFRGVDFAVIFFIASVIGGILVGVAVVLEIYLSDFLKDKEHETGQNVSGQYLGVWKMSSKISRAVAIALAGPILEMTGDKQSLANFFGWGVGLFFVLAALIMLIPIDYGEKTAK